jgi:hypothetical protein
VQSVQDARLKENKVILNFVALGKDHRRFSARRTTEKPSRALLKKISLWNSWKNIRRARGLFELRRSSEQRFFNG